MKNYAQKTHKKVTRYRTPSMFKVMKSEQIKKMYVEKNPRMARNNKVVDDFKK